MLSTSATILREPVLSYGRHGQFSRGQVGDQGHVLAVPFDHVVVGQSRVAVGRGGDAAADEKVVVCDRYLPSSLALQAIDGLESDTVWPLNAGVYVADVVVLLNADPPVIAERLRQRGAHSRFERQPGGSRHVSYPKPDHGDYGVMIISRVQARSVDFGDRVGYLVSRAAAVTLPAPHGPIQVIGASASSVISTSSNPITNGATSSSHHSNTTSTG